MNELVLVVPCFNEQDRLDDDAWCVWLNGGANRRLLFVNDGSTDNTQHTLERLREREPSSIDVLTLDQNSGKAEAVRRGLLLALEGSPGFVGFWDADLATPLNSVQQLLDVFTDRPAVQMVFGSRVQLMGRSIQRRSWRHYSGRVFATVVSTFLGLPIYDTQCGAKLFRATPELSSVLHTPFVTRWLFDVEIIKRYAIAHGTNTAMSAIYESPLDEWRDVGGSSLSLPAYVVAAGTVVRLIWHYGVRSRA